LRALFSEQYVGNYIPITMLSHSIAWFLFEESDAGHHAVNILLHILNGVLVYLIGRKLFENNLVANIGAVIFLLHPLQIESVGWICELKVVLLTTFYLLLVNIYIIYISD